MPLVERKPVSRAKPIIQIQPSKKIAPTFKPLPPRKWTGEIERIGVSVEEAAVMVSLSVRSIWVLIKDGRVQHARFGTRVIVSVKSLREFVDGKKESASPLKNDDDMQIEIEKK
jgi:hypothetical protein